MKIGVYGGTFNPVHSGHVKLAEAYLKGLELDRMLVIPAKTPPHKRVAHLASGADRLAMCRLAFPGTEYDDYVPDPTNVYIYELDTDGYLTDVTDQFTYSEDNDSTTGIEGWSIKTRTLGTYIVSDTELDLDVAYVEDDTTTSEEEASSDASSTSDGDKTIPNTGSSDMVNVAVAAAVVSLAAAGALAFKKASK